METDVMAELIPNYFENKEAELAKRSAIKWADKFSKDVPILMLHGNSDWRVKPEQSLKLALEFEKHRIPFRLVMFEARRLLEWYFRHR
ncbi:MAG: prolyl oligopeptidase family serine peptidase [Flavobacteriales bacterium]